ncbi:MAG TPA: VWA domain-containing protein [Candidatus Nanoarchaeia archaeon]|nr:VWA domain-containing protein [Candidatus Nanoarchaeia archaeon]
MRKIKFLDWFKAKETKREGIELDVDDVEEMIRKGWWDLYISNLPRPIVIDTKRSKTNIPYDLKKGIPRGFSIDPETWITYFNCDDMPEFTTFEDAQQYARSVGGHHETSHFSICPGSKRMNVRLVDAALKGFTRLRGQKGADSAHLVTNIFADWIIDTYVGIEKYGREDFGDLTKWRMRVTIDDVAKKSGGKFTPLWKVLVGTYEKMWDSDLNLKNHVKLDRNESNIVEQCVKIMGKDFKESDKWPEKSRKVAGVLENLIIESDKNRNSDKGYEAPDDVKEQCGPGSTQRIYKINGRNGKESKDEKGKSDEGKYDQNKSGEEEGRQVDAEVLDEIYKLNKDSPGKFAGTLAAFMPDLVDDAIKLMYRSRAREYLIKVTEKRDTGNYSSPAGFSNWNPGDPLAGRGGLEILPALMSHGAILPGINTKRKKYEVSQVPGRAKQIADLIYYVDSSESMNWNPKVDDEEYRGSYDKAIVAAHASALYALDRGARVAIVNFSGDNQYKFQDFTKNLDRIEDALVFHYNGGTVFPISVAEKMVKKNKNRVVSIYISDFELSNRANTGEFIKKNTNKTNPSYLFDIGGGSTFSSDLRKHQGITAFDIKSFKDLGGIVIGSVKDEYR